jgi:hypothetical protein
MGISLYIFVAVDLFNTECSQMMNVVGVSQRHYGSIEINVVSNVQIVYHAWEAFEIELVESDADVGSLALWHVIDWHFDHDVCCVILRTQRWFIANTYAYYVSVPVYWCSEIIMVESLEC